jgi:SSS family solute:Na+ symporter
MIVGWVYATIGIYAVIVSVIAFASSKIKVSGTSEGFFLADRRIGGVVGALAYSGTTYSAFMMVGLAGLAYKGGIGALGFELIYLSGLVLAAFFGPRFWFIGKHYGCVSPAELLEVRYENKTVSIVFSLICMVFLIPYTAAQLMGVGYLLSGITGGKIPFMNGVIISVVLSVLWALIAGFRSVIWTDVAQALIMFVSSFLALTFGVNELAGGFGNLFISIQRDYPQWLSVPGPGYFTLPTFIGLTLPWVFFCISNPQVSQRLFVPRSLKSMRNTIMGFLVFGFFYTLISVMWGLLTRVVQPGLENPDLATPVLLGSGAIPPIIALLVLAGIVSAAISTIDAIVLTLSSMFSRDIFRNLVPNAEGGAEVLAGKVFIIVMSLVSLVFAGMQFDLIAVLSVLSSTGLLMLVPTIVGVFFWRGSTAAGSIASMLTGITIVFVLQITGIKPLGQWPALWGFAGSCAAFVAVSLLTVTPKNSGEFFGVLGDFLRRNNVV